MKKDILTRDDVVLFVNTFYDKVKTSSILGHIFSDVAKVNWDIHFPKMYSFCASILLNEHSFKGNPMVKHIELSKLTKMSAIVFSEWLLLFNQTIDNLFKGETADKAKLSATNIAKLMQYNINIHKTS